MTEDTRQKTKKKKALAGTAIGLYLLGSLAVFIWIGIPMVRLASKPEVFRMWMEERHMGGQFAYMGMVFLQVIVAVIPGEPLEIVGGYAFGVWKGTLLCLLASSLGSIAVFSMVRKFGVPMATLFFDWEKLEKLHFIKNSPRRDFLLMLVFALPGTPKDIICYFAGLTDVPFPIWILISSLGRIPSIITSTIGGDALGTGSYAYAVIVFSVTMIVSGFGLWLYNLVQKRKMNKDKNE